jgi:uncharacterized membrane-anchored protein YhcB (DUF1043 family)
MTAFACLLIGLGLGMALAHWLDRNRPDRELEDVQDTLDRCRVDLHNARAELIAADAYAARLIEDPAFYFEQRNGPPEKSRV